ncbi:hypothetical protein J1N35_005414 [Gossypium stocksii]|uniref:Protein kinase domain-containing protein n=1 Tax=Gossypium stocksii TaxID=47602 RepID=A0A9D4AIK7_9ROSI|nr:hypothetical protein J1N35_005414 [Gossypium stocksii]
MVSKVCYYRDDDQKVVLGIIYPDPNHYDLWMKIACSKHAPAIPQETLIVGKDFLIRYFASDPHQCWNAEKLITHPFLFPEQSQLMAFAPRNETLLLYEMVWFKTNKTLSLSQSSKQY